MSINVFLMFIYIFKAWFMTTPQTHTTEINRYIDAAGQRGRMREDKRENRREGWI